jgi:hypothetical protein
MKQIERMNLSVLSVQSVDGFYVKNLLLFLHELIMYKPT